MQAIDSKSIERIIRLALEEDIGEGDITTDSIVPEGKKARAVLKAEEEGVVCGLMVAELLFKELNPSIEFKSLAKDGDQIGPGQELAKIEGNARALLTGERVALNFLQRLSGVATITRKFVESVKPYKVKILDTRKTTPGMRSLEKYAVRCGGGKNHRMGLYDMVLIKDNHIRLAGSVEKALKDAGKAGAKTEIEAENLNQVKEALESRPDIIMLDNMPPEDMEKAVKLIKGRALTEASGGITLSNLKQTVKTGVDFISIGSLTHSFNSLSISMEIVKEKP